MADFAKIQHKEKTIANRNPTVERCNGTLELNAFPDA